LGVTRKGRKLGQDDKYRQQRLTGSGKKISPRTRGGVQNEGVTTQGRMRGKREKG